MTNRPLHLTPYFGLVADRFADIVAGEHAPDKSRRVLMIIDLLFTLATILGSVMIHELAHGFVADRLGDPTPRLAGRLTFNPLAHLDLIGSILVPALLLISGSGFLFGWAKPVPINPDNLPDRQFDEVKVAIAGPLSNLLLAIIAALIVRFIEPGGVINTWLIMAMQLNLVLAIFNLVPIPPLDGSRLLAVVLPEAVYNGLQRINTVAAFLVLFLLIQSVTFSDWLGRTVGLVSQLLLGR